MSKTTIIVPTYQEVENIEKLANSIHLQMEQAGLAYNILIMDDCSNDGSKELVTTLKQHIPIDIIVRENCNRGLSKSVMDGLYQKNNNDFLVVMDADLSHPPSTIPKMIDYLSDNPFHFILGSRYIKAGKISNDWSFFRYLNSLIATLMARLLVKVSDPMSGFFALKKDQLPPKEELNPIGYKIALEIMVKGNFKNIKEIPILFKDRVAGISKLTMNVQIDYIRHLRRLYQYKYSTWAEFFQFCVVGSTGMIIDFFFYFSNIFILGLDHKIARAISFWPAATWNWYMNRVITFGNREKTGKFKQWLSFLITSTVGFMFNWGSYVLLTENIMFFGQYKILALILGITVGVGFNFIISNLFVFHKYRLEKN